MGFVSCCSGSAEVLPDANLCPKFARVAFAARCFFFFSARALPKRWYLSSVGWVCLSPRRPRKTLGFVVICLRVRALSAVLLRCPSGVIAVLRTIFFQICFLFSGHCCFSKTCLAWTISHYSSEKNGDFPKVFRCSRFFPLSQLWPKLFFLLPLSLFLVLLDACVHGVWWRGCTQTTKKKNEKTSKRQLMTATIVFFPFVSLSFCDVLRLILQRCCFKFSMLIVSTITSLPHHNYLLINCSSLCLFIMCLCCLFLFLLLFFFFICSFLF